MTRWVVDTGPLIFLAKLGLLNLLQSGADEVFIPPAVLDEVCVYSDEATERIQAATHTWLQVRKPENQTAVKSLLADLNVGEAQTLVLATEVNAERVILDDMEARRFAQRVGLSPVGTLGLLLAARLRGELSSVQEEVEKLKQMGFWINDDLAKAVIQAAGEIVE
jgi:predicted nucleic acid-binding protein